jgi:hypothetical protein
MKQRKYKIEIWYRYNGEKDFYEKEIYADNPEQAVKKAIDERTINYKAFVVKAPKDEEEHPISPGTYVKVKEPHRTFKGIVQQNVFDQQENLWKYMVYGVWYYQPKIIRL